MPPEVVIPRASERHAIQQRLRELLASRGRNALKGGDYYIVEPDAGTYEQKVLMFHDRVPDKPTIKAVSKMLEDYSMDWSVRFLKANKDGTEVTPEAGVEVCSHNLVMDIYPFMTPEEVAEYETAQRLYDELVPFFAARGTDDGGLGHGDYWLWDDKWVPLAHRIHINNIEFLTPTLIEEIQQILKRYPNYALWMQIDAKAPGVDVPCEGIRVFADRIEEDWDRNTLRAIFKDRFKF
jgi:hypothetical protein